MRVSIARNADRPDPLDWIATNPVRTSPFWMVARMVAEALEPGTDAPWYARFSWVNLYSAAPENPPGNPDGPLRQAQDPLVGELLRVTVEMLEARTVIALVGPYWWPAGCSRSSSVRSCDRLAWPAEPGSWGGTRVVRAAAALVREPTLTFS